MDKLKKHEVMKTRKFVWILIALIVGSTTVFAQGRFNRRCVVYSNASGPGTCLTVLTDLSETQKTDISELESSHQQAMAELRIKQRSTYDLVEKNAIRADMLKKVEAHRNEVRKLLTEEQQKQYDLLHAQYGYGRRNLMAGRQGGRWQSGYGRRGFRGGW